MWRLLRFLKKYLKNETKDIHSRKKEKYLNTYLVIRWDNHLVNKSPLEPEVNYCKVLLKDTASVFIWLDNQFYIARKDSWTWTYSLLTFVKSLYRYFKVALVSSIGERISVLCNGCLFVWLKPVVGKMCIAANLWTWIAAFSELRILYNS